MHLKKIKMSLLLLFSILFFSSCTSGEEEIIEMSVPVSQQKTETLSANKSKGWDCQYTSNYKCSYCNQTRMNRTREPSRLGCRSRWSPNGLHNWRFIGQGEMVCD